MDHKAVFRYINDTAVCRVCGSKIRWLSKLAGWVHA